MEEHSIVITNIFKIILFLPLNLPSTVTCCDHTAFVIQLQYDNTHCSINLLKYTFWKNPLVPMLTVPELDMKKKNASRYLNSTGL